MNHVHVARYEFRLPFVPNRQNANENAETLEGMLVTWDGSGERLDYGMGFQWYLNPWVEDQFGQVRSWSDAEGGRWEPVGTLRPDTEWHVLTMEVDYPRQTTVLRIDGHQFTSYFAATRKPENWGRETSARVQAEIISCYPGSVRLSALHRAEFRNWSWEWR